MATPGLGVLEYKTGVADALDSVASAAAVDEDTLVEQLEQMCEPAVSFLQHLNAAPSAPFEQDTDPSLASIISFNVSSSYCVRILYRRRRIKLLSMLDIL